MAAARAAYPQEFGAVLDAARVWVNGDEPTAGEATPLADGDEVAVIPPVSGGAGDRLTIEQLTANGLYDPAAADAPQRLELLDYLLDLGATLDDLGAMRDELPALASVLVLRPGRERLTFAEAAERAGVPIDHARRAWRASGLPDPGQDDRVCSEADVEMFQIFLMGAELFGEDVALQLGRVMGSAVARIAEATRSVFLVQIGAPRLAEDPTGLALAHANVEAVAMLPGLTRAFDIVLRHQLALVRRPIGAFSGYDSQRLTVGFVDLVGSTALAQQLPIGELGAALTQFEALAADAVSSVGGRLVKLIGDEAMFAVADPAAACAIALEIVAALTDHPVLPAARAGLASGEVLAREGDYFGPVVNLAARVVKLATPGTVLVSADVAESCVDHRFTPIGDRDVRGFDGPVVLHRVEQA